MIKILKYGEISNNELLKRSEAKINVEGIVADIIAAVRLDGDAALLSYTEKFDGVRLESLLVNQEEIDEAVGLVEREFIETLEKAAANIYAFHSCQVRNSFIISENNGVIMGQRIIPIDRAGLYVPGGTAVYPSTVLMCAIPAKIALCREIIMTTPCGKDGKVNPAILAAARVAGVDRIFKVGGAQAIAAMAYGTECIPRVDKIVGPGNAFVAEAKKQVFGQVAIDSIAGPSEILVVADNTADPGFVAADLLSQAEHDKMACSILVTDSMEFAEAVQAEIELQLPRLLREEIARASIEDNGKIIVADSLSSAITIANEIAPEHLELCVENPFDYLNDIHNAASIFMGKSCPEALGDYLAGPNHTLPTSGTARFASPLSVDDFIKKSQYTYFTKEAFSKVAEDIARFANKEGLTGHARSALIRMEE